MPSHRVSRRAGIFLALGLLVQAALLPSGLLAKVPAVSVSVTPFPDNATSGSDAFVTAGKYIAFDVSIRNNGKSNVVKLQLSDDLATGSSSAATYIGTLLMGGSAAGQTHCSSGGSGSEFACDVGTFRSRADLQLRVIYLTPATPGTLDITFIGLTSGRSSSDPGRSHGDAFTGTASVDLVSNFANGGDFRTSGYVPPQGDDLQTSFAGFGPSNPMWTHLTVSSASISNQDFGTTASIEEADSFDVVCPLEEEVVYAYSSDDPDDDDVTCFGQTSHITLADGALLAAPFRVEIRVDNARHYTSLEDWTIIHVLDDGSSFEIVDQPCIMSAGTPVNAPCLQSKTKASDDHHDFIAVLWLTRNGYIRNG